MTISQLFASIKENILVRQSQGVYKIPDSGLMSIFGVRLNFYARIQ